MVIIGLRGWKREWGILLSKMRKALGSELLLILCLLCRVRMTDPLIHLLCANVVSALL